MSENVVIRINVTADADAIEKVQARLAKLAAQAQLTESRFADFNDHFDHTNKVATRVSANLDETSGSMNKLGAASGGAGDKLKKTGKTFDDFGKKVKKFAKSILGIGFKLFLIQTGLAAASLLAINAAFSVGAVAAKAYQVALAGAAYGAAALGAALASVAAAQRQYTAASSAYRYQQQTTADGTRVSKTQSSRTALRSLTGNQATAMLGGEALTGAFAAINQSTTFTANMVPVLTALGDFAAAGGDVTKNFQAAAQFVGLVAKEGKVTEDALAAISDMPALAEALKKSAGTDAKKVFELLTSGALAKQAGVDGQLLAINNTVVGTLKRNFQMLKEEFADLGQPMLGSLQTGIERLGVVVRRTLFLTSSSLATFGSGTLVDGIVRGADKLSNAFTHLVREQLPRAGEAFRQVRSLMSATVDLTRQFVAKMRELEPGGEALWAALKPVVTAFGGGFVGTLDQLNKLFQDNRAELVQFGEAVAKLLDAISKVSAAVRDAFFNLLPTLTRVLTAISQIVSGIGSIIGAINKLGAAGNLIAIFGAVFGLSKLGEKGAFKNGGRLDNRFGRDGTVNRGRRILGRGAFDVSQNASIMNVTAEVVNVGQGNLGRGIKSVDSVAQAAKQTSEAAKDIADVNSQTLEASKQEMSRRTKLTTWLSNNKQVGTAIGLSLLAASPWGVSDEARGAIALGSGLAMINPKLGIAAAGIGTAATSQTPMGGLVSGAIGGGVAGATIGSVIPGVGTVVGGIAGTIIGGTSGYLMGGANQRRARREDAKQYFNTYKDQADVASSIGDRRSLDLAKAAVKERAELLDRYEDDPNQGRFRQTLKDQGKMTPELKKMLEAATTYKDELEEQITTFEENEKAFKRSNDTLEQLGMYTGRTREELQELALNLGVDLSDATTTLAEKIKLLKQQMTFKDVKFKLQDELISAFEKVREEFVRPEETAYALDEYVRGLRGKYAGTGATMTAQEQYDVAVKGAEFMMAQSGGNAITAYRAIKDAFMSDPSDPKSMFYGKNSPLAGIDPSQMPKLLPMMQRILETGFEQKARDQLGQSINQKLSELGITGQAGYDAKNIQRMMGTLSLDEVEKLSKDLFADGVDQSSPKFRDALDKAMKAASERLRSTASPAMEDAFQNAIEANQAPLTEAFSYALRYAIAEAYGRPLPSPPGANRSQTVAPTDPTDTRVIVIDPVTGLPRDTPTSRLARTMSRHSQFNSMLPGNRTVTSSLRSNMLGSIDSDHSIGAAYDLVGQNLGAYSKMVNDAGGFAEFHGGIGDRHLHVVPPQGPVGDTTVPSLVTSGAGSGYVDQSTVAITVNAAPGQSEQAIAEAVMRRLEATLRSRRERM